MNEYRDRLNLATERMESFYALDPDSREDVLQVIHELNQEKKTRGTSGNEL